MGLLKNYISGRDKFPPLWEIIACPISHRTKHLALPKGFSPILDYLKAAITEKSTICRFSKGVATLERKSDMT
jgi:hypothetical protein